ncbi:lysylphosphatidylglycerol synthase transmembrane domain-containing protein [Streptomyces sp. DT2A-34]|nr:lysylphosphatidylglycerol synthase transmembrane domain-containing protein [Streptomyces sp. DT2A-34]MDO0910276.1 lysylphosphatidylglycerol synthase transmembrane domain-containing protein [Streptomyces sp. DT2A-34]
MSVETVAQASATRRGADPRERRVRTWAVSTVAARREAPSAARLTAQPSAPLAPDPVAVSPCRIGVIVAEPHSETPALGAARPRTTLRTVLSRLNTPAFRTHLGTAVGVVILAVLFWRLGTGVFLDGLRRIDGPALGAALGIGLVTTAFSAWRWQLVARGLRIRLPLGPAVADYYRALFLNAALPGGVLGDVHRAVRHGQSAGDMGRGVRTVVLERTAGQVVLAVAGAAVLLTMPSPVLNEARDLTPVLLFAAVGALAVVAAVRMNRAPSRRDRTNPTALRTTLGEAREALLSRRNGPGVAVSSVVVLAGHLAMFVLAARIAGSAASVAVLVPLAVLALLAMGLPLNVGGFGPREGVTAWAFGAAGLGADTGLAVAVVYGVLSFVAALPGVLVLVARWYAGLRTGSGTAATEAAPEPGRYALASPVSRTESSAEVSSDTYAPKESARLASSCFPFSAEASEGRPMTPESV